MAFVNQQDANEWPSIQDKIWLMEEGFVTLKWS